MTEVHSCACCSLDAVQGRRKSGMGNCPICEEEKRKRLECSDGKEIVYYYGNASETETKTDQEFDHDCMWDVKEEDSPVQPHMAANGSPPLVARASTVIYYSQTSLE